MQEVFTPKPIRLHCLSACGGRMTNPQRLLQADGKLKVNIMEVRGNRRPE